MSWGAAIKLGATAVSAWSANKQAKDAKEAAKAGGQDPRARAMLWGEGDKNNGLIGHYQGLLDDPRTQGSLDMAGASSNYLTNNGANNLGAIHGAATQAMQGNSSPEAQAAGMTESRTSLPAYVGGSMVDAPSQNGIDLKDSYGRFVNGTPGANQYLDQSINGAIAQNRLGFQQLQDDQTKNLMQNVLPSIRGSALGAGQFGGSRQGIAEGNAIGTMQTELARAGSQFGQNATNASVGAKANAYETDSNRALSATQGLGAQQYGVASQNAATKNAAEAMNVGNLLDVTKMNTNLQQQSNVLNAGFTQQRNLANQAAQLQTNGQNNSMLMAGAGLLGGLTQQAGQNVDTNDNWALNRAQGVNQMLTPYLGQQFQQQPGTSVSGNTMAGGMAGLGMANQFMGMFGGSGTSSQGQQMGGFADLFGKGGFGGSGGYI